MSERPLTDRERLFAAFSATLDVCGELVIFERDEPSAPAALRVWAEATERSIHESDLGDCGPHNHLLWVGAAEGKRGIQVYCRGAR